MLVLGLDPGSLHTGYGVVERRGSALRALDLGRFSSPPRLPLADRLAHLAGGLAALLERWQPQLVALETPYHGLNSRSLIVLAEARGALLVTLAGRGLLLREYSPAEVKSAVTGNGRADKLQVARMVKLLLALEGDGWASDATDALALAICAAQRARLDGLAGR
ncbi:MAG TPA: crossover junction endodeoxyribonuclease RuvC [Thermoanaerobaculia bacterium]|nr:crossover junction endodeoxyribonuclease RuvC [Thermoanaerobaculia bacterium]